MSKAQPNAQAVKPTGRCPADFDFFDQEVLNCPYDFYRVLQEQAPVYQLPDTNIFMSITFGCVWMALAIYSIDSLRAARGV